MFKVFAFFLISTILLFSAKGLGFHAYDLYQKGKASEEWVATEARVEKFEAYQYKGSTIRGSNHHLIVAYSFTVDDISYTGNTLGFGPYSKGELDRPNRHGNATIHYNAADPNQSVYVKGVSTPNLFALLFALGLSLFGLIFGFLGLKFFIQDSSKPL